METKPRNDEVWAAEEIAEVLDLLGATACADHLRNAWGGDYNFPSIARTMSKVRDRYHDETVQYGSLEPEYIRAMRRMTAAARLHDAASAAIEQDYAIAVDNARAARRAMTDPMPSRVDW